MKKELCKDFVDKVREGQVSTRNLAKELCRELLKEENGKMVEFCDEEEEDPSESDLPCSNFSSAQYSNDVVSANVMAVWLDDEDGIWARLFFYYDEGEIETHFMENDYDFDWLELLDCLAQQ